MSERDTYYERNDVVPELLASAESADFVESLMMQQAAREIADLRRCLCVAVDAYCHADTHSDGHKQVVLSDTWHVWAQHLILNRVRTAKAIGDGNY